MDLLATSPGWHKKKTWEFGKAGADPANQGNNFSLFEKNPWFLPGLELITIDKT